MPHAPREPSPTTPCAIDFGTSNSAIAIATPAGKLHLVELEPGRTTMPTAVFYGADGPGRQPAAPAFGRAAIAAYVDGIDGRLMRSMKSLLGSALLDHTTDVGGGRQVRYRDILSTYLAHLLARAERHAGAPLRRAVLGRPVYFVDDDPARDAQAQAALEAAAYAAGLREVRFQFEPIAAAFDYERSTTHEQLVLVADIGGGTSDFSVVRVGPDRIDRPDRHDDILANHGLHLAGTDFDRRVALQSIWPAYGFGADGPATAGAAPRPVPSRIYFDLSTWHLINTVYQPARVAELRGLRRDYGDVAQHDRLWTVVSERLGHDIAARAEQAKIDVSDGGTARIDLGLTESGLQATLDTPGATQALASDVARIVAAAAQAVSLAGLSARDIDALYFTGGSTGLTMLTGQLGAAFPGARRVHGDPHASVAIGLGLYAQRCFRV